MNQKYIKEYTDFLKRYLDIKKDLKVVFDCSNGTTGMIVKELFPSAVILNGKPDGRFPDHSPNPLEKGATDRLKKEVLKRKADAGIIFDADGDRAVFVDDKGETIDPDIVAYMILNHAGFKKVIVDPRSGYLVREDFINGNNGIKKYESAVGHYFIKKIMKEKKAEFAYEKSGHYYFNIGNELFCDFGILAAIYFLNALSDVPATFSQYWGLIPQYARSGEKNYELRITNYESFLKAIEQKYKKQAKKISKIDGLRMDFDGWWFNVRPSNTEPYLRMNLEATNNEILKRELSKLTSLVKKGSK